MKIDIKAKATQVNDEIAQENRNLFKKNNVFVINIMSSPGAGKTSLLEKTLEYFTKETDIKIGVIEGDLQTSKDADRIAVYNVPVYQINTIGGCHLDAKMIKKALNYLDLSKIDVLLIENVGNLVCPASFDLGEDKRVVILSTPEGSDKPAKYPKIFRDADLVIINKIDIMSYCNFNLEEAKQDLYKIKSNLEIITLSCLKNINLEKWYNWIIENNKHSKNK